ncbi:hypothetical protein HPP92_005705 [Vanilla planifolia]|uniref:BHLH domain-containing protein n=1 Tax=Vanilla planifolia TaxID=51239 RepID=A0A835VFN8_VANPL|nr:hypothetical protein HPP92_005705 [Vanilla planifolia]
MVSDNSTSSDGEANASVDKPANEAVSSKKIKGKFPNKIHKAEREKLKRDQLNELFFELGRELEPTRQNNGKASILCDATRFLRDLIIHVGSLRKENASLLNESHYVTLEKNELQEDITALETEISRLQKQLQERMHHNHPPISEPNCSVLHSKDSSIAPLFVVPLSQGLHQTLTDAAELPSPPKTSLCVSRPHARYPNPTDSWPLEFLCRNQKASGRVGNFKESHEGVDEA